MKKLTVSDITWRVECLPDDMPVRGNAVVTGDDEEDRRIEDQIIEDMEWNEWAWCTVRVVGEWEGIEADEYLGGCSYKSKEDFCRPGEYFPDMQKEVLRQIQTQAERIAASMSL